MEEKKYVADVINDDFLQWETGERIVISTPTGSGKTTFVVEKLLKYAAQKKKHIAYYCNRKVLYDQFTEQSRDKIVEIFGEDLNVPKTAYEYLHIFTYQESELTKNYPKVTFCNEGSADRISIIEDDILYYIFDEAHYFINDALINSRTNFWYESKLQNGISVFLTATPKPLLTFFAGWHYLSIESNMHLYDLYQKYQHIENNLRETINRAMEAFIWECKYSGVKVRMPEGDQLEKAVMYRFNPLKEWFDLLDAAYKVNGKEILVYDQCADYSYIDTIYIKEYDDILLNIELLADEKWIVFVDNELEGERLLGELNNKGVAAAFLSASRIKRDKASKEVYENIVKHETFAQTVLIATSALDCGINIKDKRVKNIVIANDDETTFLQMLGRKRVDTGEKVRLYVKYINTATILHRYTQSVKKIRRLLRFSLKNTSKLLGYGKTSRKRPYEDGHIYGSFLSADELDQLIDEFLVNKETALYCRAEPRSRANYYGHIKQVPASSIVKNKYNNDLVLKEYSYSKTAFLKLIMCLYNYHEAMRNELSENDNYNKLCDHIYNCVFACNADGRNTMEIDFVIDETISGDRFNKFPFLSQQNSGDICVDFRSNIDRDLYWYLRHQLSWIGKKYDRKCWINYEDKLKTLIDFLDSITTHEELKEDDAFHEQQDFARQCMIIMADLPVCPKVLRKDLSRYIQDPNKYPKKNKLNKCFEELSLHYQVISFQKKYPGVTRKKTCWRLEKTEYVQE